MIENAIVKAVITYSDGWEATFVGEPLNLSEVPFLSSAQQVGGVAPVVAVQAEEASIEPVPGVDDVPSEVPYDGETTVDAPVETPVETPVEATPTSDETAPTEAAPAE